MSDWNDPRLEAEVAEHPFPLLFVTVSGAHLYGFPSRDSDFDLRGVHLLPLEQTVGLITGEETIERSHVRESLEIDLVTHEAKKFFGLLLRKNGYVLEQLYSPLVLRSSPLHEELKKVAEGCITRHHSHHYFGFAETQWKLFSKEQPRRVKPLLYTFRVLLTGIHLMRSGRIEANLRNLNEDARLPYLDELIERKLSGPEKGEIANSEIAHYEREYERLRAALQQAYDQTALPEAPTAKPALHDFLIRLRLGAV